MGEGQRFANRNHSREDRLLRSDCLLVVVRSHLLAAQKSASGARGVGIGRPYIWGLSAFGEEGVERVLEILHAELRMTMQQMGTPAIETITAAQADLRDV